MYQNILRLTILFISLLHQLHSPTTFVISHLSLVISSFFRLHIPPLRGSQRKLGMCKGEVLFVFSLPARVARTVICSFIVRHLFVICSFIVRSLFVHSLFVFSLSACRATTARAARTVICLFNLFLKIGVYHHLSNLK